MIAEIKKAGGRIDAVYFCPDVDETSPNRKPNPGMGLQAVKDFPDIDLSKSIMIGNTLSDMQFGRNLGIKTIFLPTTRPEVDLADNRIDAVYESLASFAKDLERRFKKASIGDAVRIGRLWAAKRRNTAAVETPPWFGIRRRRSRSFRSIG